VLQTALPGQARFDHNPVTGDSLGLLVEEQRTNLLLNSDTLSTQSVTVTAVAHTLSFYGTGTVTLSGVSTAGPLVGTGAFPSRVTLTFTPTAGTLTLTVSGSVTFAQLEAGAFATSYIPTTTTALTRNADVASMTGRNFSDWYNASEGSLYGESSSLRDTATRWPFAFDDGSATNLIGVRFTSTQVQNRVFVNSVAQADIVTAQTTGYAKTALGYQTNNFAAAVNDVLVGTDTSGTIPVVSQFTIGRVTGGSPICGHIRKLAYYPERLSNEQLRALTT
jgi:hypothetical protein